MKTQKTPHQVLKQYWGYDDFRPLQLDIVQSVLDGRDTLALLPTGGGKSVCFQVPALCMEGICIVVSPLIALMKDQVQNLQKRGVSAYAIYSGMHYKDIDRIFDNCVHGNVRFLYLSPERLATAIAKARIPQMKVNSIAVDEAHCISQWGYDFRPSYLNIAEIRELLPKTPIVALTATATSQVVDDMQIRLNFRSDAQVFRKSFMRKNLVYVVLKEADKNAKLLDILKKVPGSGVVYVMNRRQTKEIATFLSRNRISADYYHAGLSTDHRSEIQERWIKNKIRIIVATNAFGMGIDKPDVRVVVHMTLPDSLEAYFQEAGRGGRDGKKAFGVLLYNESDRTRLEKQYEQAFPPIKEVRQVYRALGSYYQLAIGAGQGQSFDFELLAFSKNYNLHPLKVLQAFKILTREGYLELTENIFFPPTFQVIVSRDDLYDYRLRNSKMEGLLNAITRQYQGVATHQVNIKEQRLAKSLGMSVKQLNYALYKLHKDKIIDYRPRKDVPQLTFIIERLNAMNITVEQERFQFLKKRHENRMLAALGYAEKIECRSKLLLAYFDEHDSPACGKCDVCLERHKTEPDTKEFDQIRDQLKQILKQHRQLGLNKLLAFFPNSKTKRVLYVINHLTENEFLMVDKYKQIQWKF
ncbi:MAG: RecQ family ATP-dependent DNA helicase [Saprospiraceae bacterium]|nr:RecQ family ATP-dependent DNA helicase [Saprospiraceae bacterium]